MKSIIALLLLITISITAVAQVEFGTNAGLVATTFLDESITTVKWGAGISIRFPISPTWGIRLEANYIDRSFKGKEIYPEPFDFNCSQAFLDLDLIMDYRARNKFGVLFGLYSGTTLYENDNVEAAPSGYIDSHTDGFEIGVLGGISYTLLDKKLTIEARAQLGTSYRYAYATYKLVARYNIPLKKKS